MSPEQARGLREVGPETDIWGFCATLYESLTGTVPFHGENYNAVLWAIQNVEPVHVTVLSPCDAALGAIVMRGLMRESSARWRSAAELSCELSRWLLAHEFDTDICGSSVRSRAAETAPIDLVPTPPSPLPSRSAITVKSNRPPRDVPSPWERFSVRGGIAALVALSVLGTATFAVKLVAETIDEARGASPARSVPAVAPDDEKKPAVAVPRQSDVVETTDRATLPIPAPPAAMTPRPQSPTQLPASAAETEPTAPTTERAPSEAATRPTTSVVERVPPSRKKNNALGYDFGL
jgi:serine/threonine-protein kinase